MARMDESDVQFVANRLEDLSNRVAATDPELAGRLYAVVASVRSMAADVIKAVESTMTGVLGSEHVKGDQAIFIVADRLTQFIGSFRLYVYLGDEDLRNCEEELKVGGESAGDLLADYLPDPWSGDEVACTYDQIMSFLKPELRARAALGEFRVIFNHSNVEPGIEHFFNTDDST
jgi:hypothetical protein